VARLFTPEIAQFYEDQYRRKGVKFVKGTVMAAFEKSSSGKVRIHCVITRPSPLLRPPEAVLDVSPVF
jgi:hypothetical protein